MQTYYEYNELSPKARANAFEWYCYEYITKDVISTWVTEAIDNDCPGSTDLHITIGDHYRDVSVSGLFDLKNAFEGVIYHQEIYSDNPDECKEMKGYIDAIYRSMPTLYIPFSFDSCGEDKGVFADKAFVSDYMTWVIDRTKAVSGVDVPRDFIGKVRAFYEEDIYNSSDSIYNMLLESVMENDMIEYVYNNNIMFAEDGRPVDIYKRG